MSDFEVRGAQEFYKLSKALKAAGRTGIRKELNKRMKQAGKPLIPEVRAAALEELPKRGGLAKRMAKRPIRVVTRTGSAHTAGVSLVMPNTQPGYNEGEIRHPVFEKHKLGKGQVGPQAKPTKWVPQDIGPGRWFDDTIVENRDKVAPLLEKAVNSVLDDIVKGVR